MPPHRAFTQHWLAVCVAEADSDANFSLFRPSALVHLRRGDPSTPRTRFGRVSYGVHAKTAIVALEDVVRLFDLREAENDTTLFQLDDDDDRILDMAKPVSNAPDSTVRVICTTRELIWLDITESGPPVMRVRHRLDPDPSLSLSSAFFDGGEWYASLSRKGCDMLTGYAFSVHYHTLWSRQPAPVVIYANRDGSPVQLLADPFHIAPPEHLLVRTGLSLLTKPSSSSKSSQLMLFEASGDGGLYARQLNSNFKPSRPQSRNTQPQKRRVPTLWDDALTEQSEKYHSTREPSNAEIKAFALADLRASFRSESRCTCNKTLPMLNNKSRPVSSRIYRGEGRTSRKLA